MGLCTSQPREVPSSSLGKASFQDSGSPGKEPPWSHGKALSLKDEARVCPARLKHSSITYAAARRRQAGDRGGLWAVKPEDQPHPEEAACIPAFELLQLAEEVVAAGTLPDASTGATVQGVLAVQLAAIAIVATQGNATAAPCGAGDMSPVGLCLVQPSVAQQLASSRGYIAYGAQLTREQLLEPRASLYFCAACLQELQQRLRVACVETEGALIEEGPGADDPQEAGGATRLRSRPPLELSASLDKDKDVEAVAFHMYFCTSLDIVATHGTTSGASEAAKPHGTSGGMLPPALTWAQYCRAKEQLLKLEAALVASRKLNRRSHQMYVVQEGETAESICAALSIPVAALEAANPDVPLQGAGSEGLQCNDCIMLPVPTCLPRLYATQPKDSSLFTAASSCRVHPHALRSANLELVAAHGTRVFCEPGWVLALPGLKGECN